MDVQVQNVSAPGIGDRYQVKTDAQAMWVSAALWFVVNFLINIHVTFVSSIANSLHLSPIQTRLGLVSFFLCYPVFAYPAGRTVEWLGYKRSLVAGLVVMAAGFAAFLPAVQFVSASVFCVALVLLGAGMTNLLVALNPYVTVIGPAAKGASRLTLVNAVGAFGRSCGYVAALFVAGLIFMLRTSSFGAKSFGSMESSVAGVDAALAVVLVLLAVVLGLTKLKDHTRSSDLTQDFRPGAFAEALSRPESIWRYPWVLAAALAMFASTGAEAVGSRLIVHYGGLHAVANLQPRSFAGSFFLYGLMSVIGGFIGAVVLKRVRTGVVLCVAAVAAACLVLLAAVGPGYSGLYALILLGTFRGVMFASIFALGIQDLGPLTSKGSSLLVAALVGGAAVPWAADRFAGRFGLPMSLLVPAVCYAVVAGFGWAAARRQPPSDAALALD